MKTNGTRIATLVAIMLSACVLAISAVEATPTPYPDCMKNPYAEGCRGISARSGGVSDEADEDGVKPRAGQDTEAELGKRLITCMNKLEKELGKLPGKSKPKRPARSIAGQFGGSYRASEEFYGE